MSFSPKPSTGTRSALRQFVNVPSAHRDTHKSFTALQRQVQLARARVQTLLGAAHDNHNRVAGPLAQHRLARLARHGTKAERNQVLAVERHLKVGLEREHMRRDAGVLGRKAACFGAERRHGAKANDAVGMVRKEVRAIRLQLRSAHELDRKVLAQVPEHGRPAQPLLAALAHNIRIVHKKNPNHIRYHDQP